MLGTSRYITTKNKKNTPEEYDYLYKVFDSVDTLYIYSNMYWGNQQHLDNTPIWSTFSDADLIYNPN